ncbi:MAG TPA: ParB N-terminal domain-containing protein [Anaeromyxobacteraceae bacterium]|nr:ParB N-terminal domain-containing protein [Anaeromyxobacteraceae bacterium]
MELEPRTTVPAHATGAVAPVALSEIADDPTFRLREEGDVSALAASIGRLGQLVPIEVREIPGAPEGGPRYQVVAGFRRLAALRMLLRESALARVHAGLSDEDAWSVALVQALLGEPLLEGDLRVLSERIAAAELPPWAEELVDEALVRAPVDPVVRERFLEFLGGPPPPAEGEGAAEGGEPEEEVEVTPEELAEDVATRLWELNQDLAVASEAWKELPPEGRRRILEQARYVAQLYPILARDEEDRR